MTDRAAYQSPRKVADNLVNEVVPNEFARFRGALKTAIIAAIINRDSYWMKRQAAEIEKLRGGIRAVILKFEGSNNHDEGAFDADCETCLILHDLRALEQKGGDNG